MLLHTCYLISRIGIKLIGTRFPASLSSPWANSMLPRWAHLGLSPALYVNMGLSLLSNCLIPSKGNQTTPVSKLSTPIILPHHHTTHMLTHNHPSPPCSPHAHLQLTYGLHTPPCMQPTCSPSAHPWPPYTTM